MRARSLAQAAGELEEEDDNDAAAADDDDDSEVTDDANDGAAAGDADEHADADADGAAHHDTHDVHVRRFERRRFHFSERRRAHPTTPRGIGGLIAAAARPRRGRDNFVDALSIRSDVFVARTACGGVALVDGSGALADEGDSSSASDDTRTPRQCAAATGQLRPRRGRGCGVGGGPTVAVTPRHEGLCVCIFPAGIS